VLQAYLDRSHPDWRNTTGGAGGAEDRAPPHQAGMTVDEAQAVLGVGPEATEEEIKQAHRALMQKVHPDRGGSTYLAAQINRAKDVLLGE
jgi:DnaJ-domain-containing protein 1